MARSKFQHNKRQKELARKQKKEEKRQRKEDKSTIQAEDGQQPSQVAGVGQDIPVDAELDVPVIEVLPAFLKR